MRTYWMGILWVLSLGQALAQAPCQLHVRGQVLDQFTGEPLAYATVFVEETGGGEETDTAGLFVLSRLCAGDYHLRVSHVGCHAQRVFLSLQADTSIWIRLEHNESFIEGVVVTDERVRQAGQNQSTLSQRTLEQAAGENLAEMASRIAGVSLLRNGSGIAKPIIHGLSGNRIAVLNNGLVQAGQQWGSDHAPEIDPFTADKITVLKGVDAIPYGGNTLGGAVLSEPGSIATDPHLHGAAQYVGETNGRLHTLSARLEKGGGWAAWRLTGTFKQGGDHHTPDYFLRNTGIRERNVALQLQKQVGQQWFHQLYYSFFYTELGILRGSHIGNLTDLQQAIGREEPFFTEPDFSYRLEEPRQRVEHHLLKYNLKYYFSPNQSFQFTYGAQLNHRREYDVRRGDRSSRPALDLLLQSHFVDAFWALEKGKRTYRAGLQMRFNDNNNQPGTGILPLIPNYQLYQPSLYALRHSEKGPWAWQIGGRYDFVALEVATLSLSLPRQPLSYSHRFHNYALASGLQYRSGKRWTAKFNLGLASRSPEANELHSIGLHQGVSGIEEGDPALRTEQSLKGIGTWLFNWDDKLMLEATTYYQWINNYIFLEPQAEYRLTIRGAFPVFLYKQTDATIAGLDLTARYAFGSRLEWSGTYSLVRGRDRSHQQPLVYMPPDQLYTQLSFDLGHWGQLKDNEITVSGRYVLEQTRLLPQQDFLVPPPAYFLPGLSWSAEIYSGEHTLHLHLQVDNLLNTRYRDYLNRLRYYADEEGRNLKINLRWEF